MGPPTVSPRGVSTPSSGRSLIQTGLREWADASAFETSHQRPQALKPFPLNYNTVRTHSGIRHQTPMLRLNNLLLNLGILRLLPRSWSATS
jgi:hypothetical protein